MCKSRNSKRTPFRKVDEIEWKKVDKCLSGLLCFINGNTSFRTLGSCCGHGRYPMSIVCRSPFGWNVDICSGEIIPRTRRFYLKDSEGYYYIPESKKKWKIKGLANNHPAQNKFNEYMQKKHPELSN